MIRSLVAETEDTQEFYDFECLWYVALKAFVQPQQMDRADV